MQLPSECLDTLKCSICNQLLSIFPIYVMQNKDNQQLSICGRCEISDKEKYLRCKIYETLAKAALFPCINKKFGCLINLLPEDMKKHELVCPYKLQNCVVNECDWEGMYDDVLDHYETNHNDLILRNNTFNLNMNENYDILNFLCYEDAIFSFKYCFDQALERLECLLTPLLYKQKKQYYAQANLTTEDASMSKTFPEIDAVTNVTKSIDINMENMLNNDKNTTIIATIKIANEKNQLELVYNKQINKNVLSQLKCQTCNGLYSSFNYQLGHYCRSCIIGYCTHSNCSNRKDFCQTFQVLNEMLIHANFNCEFGCEFVAKVDGLESHYKSCFNKPQNCLLTNICMWNGRRLDFVKHILKDHNKSIINVNQLIRVKVSCCRSGCSYFLKHACHTFRLIVCDLKFSSSEFLWRVEVLSSTEQSDNFKFELTMFSDEDNDKQIIIKERCADFVFSNQKEYSKDDTPCIILSSDSIKGFIQNDTLSFKINIWK